MFSDNHIIIINNILKNLCISETLAVKKSIIFREFQKHEKNIEQYLFEKELSSLIKQKIIPGYQIKVGRKGGVIKENELIKITLSINNESFTGKISKQEIDKLKNKLY